MSVATVMSILPSRHITKHLACTYTALVCANGTMSGQLQQGDEFAYRSSHQKSSRYSANHDAHNGSAADSSTAPRPGLTAIAYGMVLLISMTSSQEHGGFKTGPNWTTRSPCMHS